MSCIPLLSRPRVVAGLWAVALALPLGASAGDRAMPVTIRLKLKTGDVTRYELNMNVETSLSQGAAPSAAVIPVKMKLTQEQKVTRVSPGGGGEVVTTVLTQEMSVNGQPQQAVKPDPVTMTYDGLGKVLSVKGLPKDNPASSMLGGGISSGGLNGMGLFLPPKPVQPGSVWTQSVLVPGSGSTGMARCKLMRMENVGKFKTARIRMNLKMPVKMMMGQNLRPTKQAGQSIGTMSGTITMIVDNNIALDDGKLVRSSGQGGGTINLVPKKGAGSAAGGGAMPAMQTRIKMSFSNNIIP